jgi:5-methyltetrahydropteroyltriglutamate--homocysteine methyltransferase
MTEAVLATVAKQRAVDVDIVSDEETSTISYATYVKDRYTGFGGDGPRNTPADLKLYPQLLEKTGE